MSDIVKVQEATIEPTNMSELERLAKHAADSKFFGAETPQQALLIMMRARDLGFSYSVGLAAFHVIKGKPCLSADAMVALCLQRKDLCEYFETVETTTTSCTVLAKRVGRPERRFTFTIEDAKAAELLSNPMWRKYPANMLRARAKAALARDMFPELLLGLYDPDELADATPPSRQIAPMAAVVVPDAPMDAQDIAPAPAAPPAAAKAPEPQPSAPQEPPPASPPAPPPSGEVAIPPSVQHLAEKMASASLAELNALAKGIRDMGLTGPSYDLCLSAYRARKAHFDRQFGGSERGAA